MELCLERKKSSNDYKFSKQKRNGDCDILLFLYIHDDALLANSHTDFFMKILAPIIKISHQNIEQNYL
jgi:hypothetical protein